MNSQVNELYYYYSDLKQKLSRIIRDVSISRMRLQADFSDFQLEEVKEYNPHGYVYSNFMSLIIIAGQSIRITFKTYFNHDDSKPIARRLYGTENINKTQSLDVMKEYCNLTAGYLKKILMENNNVVGISMPIVTRGFNEVFTSIDNKEGKLIFEDCWQLTAPESIILCSYHADILDPKSFNMLSEQAAEIEETNENDFVFL